MKCKIAKQVAGQFTTAVKLLMNWNIIEQERPRRCPRLVLLESRSDIRFQNVDFQQKSLQLDKRSRMLSKQLPLQEIRERKVHQFGNGQQTLTWPALLKKLSYALSQNFRPVKSGPNHKNFGHPVIEMSVRFAVDGSECNSLVEFH